MIHLRRSTEMSCILGALRNYLCNEKVARATIVDARIDNAEVAQREGRVVGGWGKTCNAANNGGHYKEAGACRAPTTGGAKCGLAHTGHTREVTDASPLLTPTLATFQRNVVKCAQNLS